MLRPIGDLIQERTPAFEISKAVILALTNADRVVLKAWMGKYIAADGSVLRPSPSAPANLNQTRERRGFPKRRPTPGPTS